MSRQDLPGMMKNLKSSHKPQDLSAYFIGVLGWKRRIYTLFTPLEDRIGIVEIIIDKGVGEKSYAFCI